MDRDGTLIRHSHYLIDPEGVEIMRGAIPALHRIQNAGILFAIVTNQSVVGRGLATSDQVESVNQRVFNLLKNEGIFISNICVCPHAPEDECLCRKPKSKLGANLLEVHGLIPSQAMMLGDQESDIQFGVNLGVKTILLAEEDALDSARTYYCRDWSSAGKFVEKELCQAN